MFSSTGKIKYDPHRADMKNRTSWWVVAEVDREITRYYRWWLQYEKHIILQKPSWDAHISIIRGESSCAQFPNLWKKYHNTVVQFEYDPVNLECVEDKKQPGQFYWITVSCPFFTDMRKELNLPTGWQFHITIGRTYF